MSTAAIAFQPRPRTRLGGAVRAELLKLRRQRLTWMLLVLVALVTGVAMGITFIGGSNTRTDLLHHTLSFYFTYLAACQTVFCSAGGIFLLALSARLVGMEYSSGAIRIVLGRGTSRLGLLVAQLGALLIAGLFLLVAFTVVSALVLGGALLAWGGSLSSLTSLPHTAWTDTGICGAVALVSIGICILIGRVTHQTVWPKVPHWFLGPTLNQLASTLQTDHNAPVLLLASQGNGPASHLWTVIGLWAAAMALATFLLTWRRDVLE